MKWSSERSAELEREVASWDWQEPEKVLERIRLLLNSAESPEEKLGLLTSEATCHQLMGRSDLAERALQMARFSGPNDPGSHLLVAYGQMRLLEDGDKWVESLALLDKMISGHDFKSISALPDWQHLVTHIFFSRGLALFSLGRFQEAEIPLREALKGSLDKEKRGPANYILGYTILHLSYQTGRLVELAAALGVLAIAGLLRQVRDELRKKA